MKKGLHYLSRNEKKVVKSFVEELRNRLGNEVIKIILFGSKIRGDFIMSRVSLARYRMGKAREVLLDADYGDFIKITQDNAQIKLERAIKFIEEAKKRLGEMIELRERGETQ